MEVAHGRDTAVPADVRHRRVRGHRGCRMGGGRMTVEPWTLIVCRRLRSGRTEQVRIERFRDERDMDLFIERYVGVGGVAQVERYHSTRVCRIVVASV